MTNRQELVETYIEGWRQWDPSLALSAVAPGFVLDDPAWPEPVTAANLAAYMARWRAGIVAVGGSGQLDRLDEISQDDVAGALLRSHYWRFSGTRFEGAALMRVGRDGIVRERIMHRNLNGVRSMLRGETGFVVGARNVGWQNWSEGQGDAPVPRYKTLLCAAETPSSEVFQGLLDYPAGTRSRPHWHTPVETYFVLSGEGEAHIGERHLHIAAGDMVYMPSRVVHWFEAAGSVPLSVLWTLACHGLDDVDFHFVD